MFRRARQFIAVLCGVTLVVGITAYAAASLHSVQFETLISDAGAVKEGQQVHATFRFDNQGRSTASILNVTPSCGVMASLVHGRTLAPGESGSVEVRINTVGHQGFVTGPVTVSLKDPLERTVVLTVKATVDREFVPESPIVDFGKVSNEAMAQRELRIRSSGTEHKVLTARSTDPNFDAHLESRSVDGTAKIVIKGMGQKGPGLKFGTIRIGTSSPHMPELIVPVHLVVE